MIVSALVLEPFPAEVIIVLYCVDSVVKATDKTTAAAAIIDAITAILRTDT